MDNEIDYEDMDDLALCEHIEWNHAPYEDFSEVVYETFC